MRLLIADDQECLRDTLTAFLAQQDDHEVVHVADIDQAQRVIAEEGPFDLVLLEHGAAGIDTLAGLRSLLSAQTSPPVVLLSDGAPLEIMRPALRLGLRGVLPKSMRAVALLAALRFMATGERFVPVEYLLARAPAAPALVTLSKREREVLEALCGGLTNKEIARRLNLSEPTIKLHVKTLYRRLGVANRTQAAMIAQGQGLF